MNKDLIIHPFETVIEALEINDKTLDELSLESNIPIEKLQHQKTIGSFAYDLKKLTNLSIEFWTNLQNQYDEELKTSQKDDLNG
jgi:plasmid maintenance system antidote protein VapI